MSDQLKYVLDETQIPEAWYNLAADLPQPIPPHRHPVTGEPATAADMGAIFPPALIEQEVSTQRWIEIPDAVRERLALWRPTPLVRASSSGISARRRASTTRTNR